MNERALGPYVYLSIAFHAALVTANVAAVKVVQLGPIVAPAGVIAYSITFPLADCITELWGRAHAQRVVTAGILTQALVWALLMIAIALPPAPFWREQQAAYLAVLGQSSRIILASLIAYLASQTLDVWLFARLQQRLHGRWLGPRNAASTFIAQTLDTGLFIVLAFWGVYPVLPLILGQLLAKYALALLGVPVVYALVYGMRRRLPAGTG